MGWLYGAVLAAALAFKKNRLAAYLVCLLWTLPARIQTRVLA